MFIALKLEQARHDAHGSHGVRRVTEPCAIYRWARTDSGTRTGTADSAAVQGRLPWTDYHSDHGSTGAPAPALRRSGQMRGRQQPPRQPANKPDRRSTP